MDTPELRDVFQAKGWVLCGRCWLPYASKRNGHACEYVARSSYKTKPHRFNYQTVEEISASVSRMATDEEEVP